MAIGELYQVVDRQEYDSQEVLNVYHYEQTVGTGGANELATAFESIIVPEVARLQNTSLVHKFVEVTNLNDLGDFGTVSATTQPAGLVMGEGLPVFVAWGLRYNRASRLVRNGYKRIAGVTETQQSGGDPIAGALADILSVAAVLQADLTDVGSGTTWKPIILRTVYSGGVPTYTAFDISSVGFYAITTQNSRKRGTGI